MTNSGFFAKPTKFFNVVSYKRVGRLIVLVYPNPKSGGAIFVLWRKGSSGFGLSLHSMPREGAVLSEQFYHVFGKLKVS
jgi:hypothetical protein